MNKDYTLKEYCDLTGESYHKVYQQIKRGVFRHKYTNKGKRIYIKGNFDIRTCIILGSDQLDKLDDLIKLTVSYWKKGIEVTIIFNATIADVIERDFKSITMIAFKDKENDLVKKLLRKEKKILITKEGVIE